jgi:SAM-dependent methyltransferase
MSSERPFYGRFAWAYDLLSERLVDAECAWIAALLQDRGLTAHARLLDAGCGTGRHAVELARHGYQVTGLDASADLLAVGRRRAGAGAVTFVHADLRTLPATPAYDAVLCRGVLNDLLEDDARRETRLDHAARQLRIVERHVLTGAGQSTVADHALVMRCWTREELDDRLGEVGFAALGYWGAYDGAVPAGETDRLVVAARARS